MDDERLIVFEHRGLVSQLSEVYWPKGLPLPNEPNLPRGSRAIEMPNRAHKGIALDPTGELYYCTENNGRYEWKLANV